MFKLFRPPLVHIALPAFSLALITFGLITRLTRSSMLEVLRQDYVRTARSKGLSEQIVIFKHALRNGMTSVVTVLALLRFMISGAIVIEYIFNWPGDWALRCPIDPSFGSAFCDGNDASLHALNSSSQSRGGYRLRCFNPRIRLD